MGDLRPIRHVLGPKAPRQEPHGVHVWSLRLSWEGTQTEAGDAMAGLASDLLVRGFSVIYEPKE